MFFCTFLKIKWICNQLIVYCKFLVEISNLHNDQKNYWLKRDAPIDFLGLNENNDHIWLEINKPALTENLPCDTMQTI